MYRRLTWPGRCTVLSHPGEAGRTWPPQQPGGETRRRTPGSRAFPQPPPRPPPAPYSRPHPSASHPPSGPCSSPYCNAQDRSAKEVRWVADYVRLALQWVFTSVENHCTYELSHKSINWKLMWVEISFTLKNKLIIMYNYTLQQEDTRYSIQASDISLVASNHFRQFFCSSTIRLQDGHIRL